MKIAISLLDDYGKELVKNELEGNWTIELNEHSKKITKQKYRRLVLKEASELICKNIKLTLNPEFIEDLLLKIGE